MILSTEFNYASILFGTERAIEIVAGAGFEGLDYSMFDLNREDNPVNHNDYATRMASFKKIAENCGVCFNQTHAPFPSFKIDDEDYNKTVYPQLIRAIEATAILGAPHVVMHPQPLGEDSLERNIEFYAGLEPYCKEYGVKIALENLIRPKFFGEGSQLAALIDGLGSDCFTGLIDVGHASIRGDCSQVLSQMGGRVTALHIHDNDAKDDNHNMPFNRGLDWEKICAALKDIGYSGDLTYEAGFYIRQFPKELAPAAYKMMAETAKYLRGLIEG